MKQTHIISPAATLRSVITPQGMTLQSYWTWRDAMASAREFRIKAMNERAAVLANIYGFSVEKFSRYARISADHYAYARRLNGCPS